MTRSIIVACSVVVVLLVAIAGCKKNDLGKPPVHQQKNVVKFSPVPPAVLPNVQAVPGGLGNIEWINGKTPGDLVKVNRKDVLAVDGWAGDHVTGTVPGTVIMQLSSGTASFYAVATRTGLKRSDIAEKTKIPAFQKSAFQLDGDLGSVPPGNYLVAFLLSDGKTILGFDTRYHLDVQ